MTTQKRGSSGTRAVKTVSEIHIEAMNGTMKSGKILFEGLARCNQECINFLAGRVQKNLDMQSRLLSCSSVSNAVDLQNGFVRTAVEEYTAQSNKMMELGSEIVKDDLDALSPRMDEKRTGKGKRGSEMAA